MTRHDVAIYAPKAGLLYDASAVRPAGGAERQTWLLAQSLARHGVRVAHITYPVTNAVIDPQAPVTLIERPRPPRRTSAARLSSEAIEVWRALSCSDAATQVFRGAAGALGIACAWSRSHKRRVVFAAANEGDLTGETFTHHSDPRALLFRAGMRLVDAVVVQTGDQVRLARDRFPRLSALEQIESFVEPAPEATAEGEAFLWVSRLADYKRPLLYPRLAAAVPEARFWMIPTAPESVPAEIVHELKRAAADLENLEILDQRRHAELQKLIGRAVAMVNTSSSEGMPNTWLEGWARGVPALTLSFDPDERIAQHGLGISAQGSWEMFVAGTRELWARRGDRGGYGPTTRAYVAEVHGRRVGQRWAELLGVGHTVAAVPEAAGVE